MSSTPGQRTMVTIARASGVVFPLTPSSSYLDSTSPSTQRPSPPSQTTSSRAAQRHHTSSDSSPSVRRRKYSKEKRNGGVANGPSAKPLPSICDQVEHQRQQQQHDDQDELGPVASNSPEPLHLLRFPLLGPTRQETQMFLKAKIRLVRTHDNTNHHSISTSRNIEQ